MLSAHEIQEVLRSGDVNQIAEAHKEVTGKEINRHCGSCITDAQKVLRTYLNTLEREKTPIVVYVNVYEASTEERKKELDECLWQNKNNPHISKVVELTGRPTYQDYFNLFEEDKVNVIVNSDIFFDETAQLLKGIKSYQCYALTRYDWNGNGHATFMNRSDSQDAWVFRGKVKKIQYADFPLGVPGCDNRIAHEIKKAGYQLTNPSKSIHALHYHTSQVRNYTSQTPAIPQPYHYVQPCALV